MKRITYISRWAGKLTDEDISSIGDVAVARNAQAGITGVLMSAKGLFFQVIEGPNGAIDTLFGIIRRDPRHRDLLCLKTELDLSARLFPDWSMRTVNLDRETGALLEPLRFLFRTLIESHQVIEHYTQPAVRKLISGGRNPLHVPPERKVRVMVMSDLVGFSTISERYPVEEVSAMASMFLDGCYEDVTERGGEVSKFIGDSVLAYFSEESVDPAIDFCAAALARFRETRRRAKHGSALAQLYAGFGVAKGPVLEGTIGSAGKADYTVLGDAVNTAARVESMTRQLGYAILATGETAAASKAFSFTPLGHHALKGKSIRIQLLAPDVPFVREMPFKTLG